MVNNKEKTTLMSAGENKAVTSKEITHKKLQPGDLLPLSVELRKLTAAVRTQAFTLFTSLDDVEDKELSTEISKTRHTLELAATRMQSLLALLEKTPSLVSMRAEVEKRNRKSK